MTNPNESRNSWIQDHLHSYISTDGKDGHIWRGVPTLLLTTTGRLSGKLHTTPLIYGKLSPKQLKHFGLFHVINDASLNLCPQE